MKNLLIFASLWAGSFFHGGHIAEYYYQLDGQNLNLKFVIEKAELMHYDFKDNCDFQNMTALCTAQYLKSHSKLQINNEKIEMELQESYTEGDRLIILLTTKWEGRPIYELTIENKCFYEFDSKFKNRIIMDVGSFNKTYLLNKTQDRITLN